MNPRLRGFAVLAAALALSLVVSARCYAKPEPNISQISYGESHLCAVTTAGELLCWGSNGLGQIGNGRFSRSLPGARVSNPTLIIPRDVTAVSAGYGHTCAIVGGALYCWGGNTSGQIGNGKTDSDGYHIGTPQPDKIIPGDVKAVSAGGSHTCAIVGEDLQCWGGNWSGQLGIGSLNDNNSKPVTVIKGGVSAVSAGRGHTCAVVRGDLWCWGSNSKGAIGNGSEGNNVLVPLKIISGGVSAVTAGQEDTCANVNGALQCWGKNERNALVPDAVANVLAPRTIIPGGVSAIAMQYARYCAVVRGALQCWGYNHLDTLGGIEVGSGTNGFVQPPRELISGGVTAIGMGERGTCVLVNGALRCRGWDPNLTAQITPSQTAPFSTAKWDIPVLSHTKSDALIAQRKSPAAITKYLEKHRVIYQNGIVYYMSQVTAGLYPNYPGEEEPILRLDIQAIPLFRSRMSAGPSSRAEEANAIALPPDATCGVDGGRAQTLESPKFYIQTSDRFQNLRDALQTNVPVLPAFESYHDTLRASASDLRKIQDCTTRVASILDSLPYTSTTYTLHGGQDVNIPASLMSAWDNKDSGWVEQIFVRSKQDNPDGFSAQAYTVSAMQCGNRLLSKWQRWQSPVLDLGTDTTLFRVNSALLLANARELPAYSEADLRRAIRAEEGEAGLVGEAEARACLPAVIGEQFQIRYRGAVVQQFSIDLPTPQPALTPNCDQALLCKPLPDERGKHIAVLMLDSNGTRRFGDAVPDLRQRKEDAPSPQDTFGMPDDIDISDNVDQTNASNAQASPLPPDSYDLGLFIVDERSGAIYSRYLEKKAYVSAPLALKQFTLDTGRYFLAPDTRAFGLRAEYSDPGSLAPQGETTLKLYVRNSDTLRLILDGLVMNKTSRKWSGACVGTSTEVKRVINIGTATRHGYADLAVTATVNGTQSKMDGGKCVQLPLPTTTKTVTLQYDRKQYAIPADMRTAQ